MLKIISLQSQNPNVQLMSPMDHLWYSNGCKWNVSQTSVKTAKYRWTVIMWVVAQLAFLEWPLITPFRSMLKRVDLPFWSRLYAPLQSPFDPFLWLKEDSSAKERRTTSMIGHRRQSLFVSFTKSGSCFRETFWLCLVKSIIIQSTLGFVIMLMR